MSPSAPPRPPPATRPAPAIPAAPPSLNPRRPKPAAAKPAPPKPKPGAKPPPPAAQQKKGKGCGGKRRCAPARDRRTGVLAVYLGITCTSHPRAAPTWALSGRGMRTVSNDSRPGIFVVADGMGGYARLSPTGDENRFSLQVQRRTACPSACRASQRALKDRAVRRPDSTARIRSVTCASVRKTADEWISSADNPHAISRRLRPRHALPCRRRRQKSPGRESFEKLSSFPDRITPTSVRPADVMCT